MGFGFSFLKSGIFFRRRFRFWRLGFFLVQAFCRIDGFAFRYRGLRRHRDTRGRTDELYIHASFRATNATPFGASHLEINGNCNPESEKYVKNHRIDEKFSEIEIFGRIGSEAVNRIDDGGVHFPLIRAQRVRARSDSGSVTILILLTPDWRKVSITLAKVPKGIVSSARRKTESCGFLSWAAT